MTATVTISQQTLVLIAALLPILVGFIVAKVAPSGLKTFVMLLVTALVALAKAVGEVDGVFEWQLVYDWILSTVVTVATYYGVYDNVTVGKMGKLGNLAPKIGIGQGGVEADPPMEGVD